MKKLIAVLALCSFAVFAEPVNINQADAATISKALKGIGPKKAEAIVQYRKEHGDFKSAQDLESVKGIGPKTIKANENDINFGEAAPVVAVPPPAVAPVAASSAVAGDKKLEKPVVETKPK